MPTGATSSQSSHPVTLISHFSLSAGSSHVLHCCKIDPGESQSLLRESFPGVRSGRTTTMTTNRMFNQKSNVWISLKTFLALTLPPSLFALKPADGIAAIHRFTLTGWWIFQPNRTFPERSTTGTTFVGRYSRTPCKNLNRSKMFSESYYGKRNLGPAQSKSC